MAEEKEKKEVKKGKLNLKDKFEIFVNSFMGKKIGNIKFNLINKRLIYIIALVISFC